MYSALFLIAVPIALFISFYVMHFSVLIKGGTGDQFMSPEFQGSLEGNKMHLDSQPVHYFAKITLMNKAEDVYLHSHNHFYPLHHEIDNKVSSEGQQVSGYSVSDKNSVWKIIPESEEYTKEDQIQTESVVRLMHIESGKFLMTHDVASALTMTNMEMTVTDDPEKFERTLWTLKINAGGSSLRSKSSIFKLCSVKEPVCLHNQKQNYPKWGFEQREMNGMRNAKDKSSDWTIASVINETSKLV